MTDSEKLNLLLDKVSSMENKFDTIDKRFDAVDKRLDSMDTRLDSLDSNVTQIRFNIENELRPNIMRIAEGHLDLNRKLNDALKSDAEKEYLSVKVRQFF